MTFRTAHILSAQALLAMAATAAAQVTHVPTFPLNGDGSHSYLGTSVSGAGDVNNDGYDDFIAGAPRADSENGNVSGMARVYSGLDGSVLYTFYGDIGNDKLGTSVSGAGDVNNDGFDDFIAGAPGNDTNGISSGLARVYSGMDGSVLYTFYGDEGLDSMGESVAGAGDVNNDGHGDLIVGAPWGGSGGLSGGSATVYSGLDGSVIHTFNADDWDRLLGWSVSGAGDVNNDGYDDLIVGAPLSDNNGDRSGSVYVYSGLDGSVLYTFNGDGAGDELGSSVSGAGDVNGDGYDDLIAGAPWDGNNGDDSGSARVYSGLDGSVLYTFNGDSTADWFGLSVSGGGDVNGDGYDDLVVGSPTNGSGLSERGTVYTYSGRDGSVLYVFNGDSYAESLGWSVSGAIDVNNDGFADLVVGAQGDSNNATASGSVRVYRSVAMPDVKPTCPGDANGDGVVDLTDLNIILGNFGHSCK